MLHIIFFIRLSQPYDQVVFVFVHIRLSWSHDPGNRYSVLT
jgi:hypothetical protein